MHVHACVTPCIHLPHKRFPYKQPCCLCTVHNKQYGTSYLAFSQLTQTSREILGCEYDDATPRRRRLRYFSPAHSGKPGQRIDTMPPRATPRHATASPRPHATPQPLLTGDKQAGKLSALFVGGTWFASRIAGSGTFRQQRLQGWGANLLRALRHGRFSRRYAGGMLARASREKVLLRMAMAV